MEAYRNGRGVRGMRGNGQLVAMFGGELPAESSARGTHVGFGECQH